MSTKVSHTTEEYEILTYCDLVMLLAPFANMDKF